jgi:hypothetical protein
VGRQHVVVLWLAFQVDIFGSLFCSVVRWPCLATLLTQQVLPWVFSRTVGVANLAQLHEIDLMAADFTPTANSSGI